MMRSLQKERTANGKPKASVNGSDKKQPTVDLEKYPGGEITVYFATQTGTAESFANTLVREGAEHGFLLHAVDLEDVKVEDLNGRVIFLASTYGEGEPPDNATDFSQNLCERANTEVLFEHANIADSSDEPTLLQGVEYTVFGLGNRQYDHYNAMGKFFDHALERLGATRVVPYGCGDDDADLESDFETWKDSTLWPSLKKKFLKGAKVPVSSSGGTVGMPDCQYAIEYHDKGTSPNMTLGEKEIHAHSRHYFSAVDCPITTIRELRTKEDPESTVHIEVDVKGKVQYETADNLGVLPVNEVQVVESVAKSLSFNLDHVFSLSAAPNHEWHGAPFPMPLSVRECLTRYCDLTQAPRRSDLKLLAAYATDSVDSTALLRMASKEGRTEYREKVLDEYVGIVDILKRCPSIQMPLEHFLSVCPLLQTRFFTISSSSSVHTNSIHMTVAVTRAQRKDGSMFKGVCSNFLASRKSGQDTIRVFNRPSSFRLPKNPSIPIVLIGPGTGIAPMRAFLQERAYQRDTLKQKVGPNIMYFGCKRATQDYLYKDELEAYQKDGTLNTLRLAFSRETSNKVYVQHLIKEDATQMYDLIEKQGAYVYVCGAVKMGQDVSHALQEILSANSSMTTDQAKEHLSQLSSQGRYIQELWA